MIENLYGKYFQKSRSFLYPALGIRRSSNISPTGTYLSLEGKIGPEDMRLIVVYKVTKDEGFKVFEKQMLLTNPLFDSKIDVKEYSLYIFNFEIYKDDWFNFLLGKYSKLSNVLKRAIKTLTSILKKNNLELKFNTAWQLNERHYGSLTGLDKEETKQKILYGSGDDKIEIIYNDGTRVFKSNKASCKSYLMLIFLSLKLF